MSNTFSKLPKQATAILLAVLLALAPAPASAMNYHWEGWYERDGCEWYGYHNYDEVRQGHVYGRTNGRGSCADLYVRVEYDGISVDNYGVGRVEASANLWSPDFERSFHAADPSGPTSWTGRYLW